MNGVGSARPKPSKFRQWWVLTVRVIAPTLRTGELLIAIASVQRSSPSSLYIPLKQIMGAVVHGSYAQWIMPS